MKKLPFSITILDLFVGIFLLWGIISGSVNTDLTCGSILYTQWIALSLVYLIISQNTKSGDGVLCLLTLIGFIQAILVIAQQIGIAESYNDFFNVTGFMGNPGPLGGFQAISAVSGLSFIALHKSELERKQFFICFAMLAIILSSIVLSGSRAGTLALIAGLMILYRTQIGHFLLRHKWMLIPIVILIAISLYMLAYYRPDSVLARLLIWTVSLQIFIDYPIIGIGPGQFNLKYMLYQAEYFRSNPDSIFSMVADNAAYPYNEFIHVIVELGFIGGLIFILLLIVVFKFAKHRHILSPLTTLLVFSCFSYPSWNLFLLILFPVFVGIAGCNKTVLNFAPNHCRHILTWLSISCIIGIASYNTMVFTKMEDYFTKYRPPDSGLNLLFAKAYTNHKVNILYTDVVLNNPSFLEAGISGKIFPMCETWCKLGELNEMQNDFDSAECYFRIAANMIPTRIKPKYLLWQAMLKQRKYDEAIKLAQTILNQPVKVENTYTLRVKQEIRNVYKIL